jgi:two-component system, OmpR family, sensor histidine kinase KdpD
LGRQCFGNAQDPREPVINKTTRRGRILRSALLSVSGILLSGLVTFIGYGLHLGFLTVSFLYLIVVVLQSLFGNFLSSAIVSVVSFLFLDYFFVPPLFSLRVSDASDTIALISFLIASLVITRLTSQAQQAADSEERQRRQMTHLYELSRLLLAMEPAAVFGAGFLDPFRTEFGLRAACLFEADTAKLHTAGESVSHLFQTTRDAYIAGRDFEDPSCQVAVRLLRVGERTAGAIGFEGLRDLELTAGPLAALATIMIERCYTFEQAGRATAAAETELFRGAVLDALAHEFKTPLATILTAASGLREIGPLRPEQCELAEVVESEASYLNQLTSRLLRLARLEREDVKPQMELIDMEDIVRPIAAQYAKRWPDRRFSVAKCERIETIGDRELLWLGLGQLLDNACKYSQPASEVTVDIETKDDQIMIHVWNSGSSIPTSERARVFERFYRGTEVRGLTPGSGLGLYVARKIAIVHGGDLDLDQVEGEGGTAFRFSIARVKREPNYDPKIQCAGRG